MYNPFSLENKTILITGASSGIGRATAIECSKLGAKVIITARNRERLQKTFDSLEGNGHEMYFCDLSDSDAIGDMVSRISEIQGLINNAGFTKLLPLQFVKEDTLKSIMQVNTIAPIMLLQKLLKQKKLRTHSSVVFTSSLAGLGTVSVGNSMYAATKGAISAFVKNAALDLSVKKIRVNAVCPAMISTEILNSEIVTKEQLEEDIKNYPLGRYGDPCDVAFAIIYLLSDASSWITGTNLIIDGGLTLK
ncbi:MULTISPECIES: SDR family NAD(P)-dependent oxidoreductase [Bacteroides]|jgi:NAD(P)-dependent dehydrogenase (short-subunit alcohol dehydrogenase family)|uniref:SDR family NAD(P)-dependent oxidoreductase n=1 Tax=Bacteroides TaxID=816 RepID=UPI000E51C91C|nr:MULTISPECIES: SDR family oxidoreductase [Bacteroides]RHL08523.1 SDR family NAD(P)-dependent oxidoreductase [Bacteroides sp. AF39-11AC]